MSDGLDGVLGEINDAPGHVEHRQGVPLEYVADKLRRSLEKLHGALLKLPDPTRRAPREDAHALHQLRSAFHHTLIAYLGLNNMLSGGRDSHLHGRLLLLRESEFRDWLDQVDRGGTITE